MWTASRAGVPVVCVQLSKEVYRICLPLLCFMFSCVAETHLTRPGELRHQLEVQSCAWQVGLVALVVDSLSQLHL